MRRIYLDNAATSWPKPEPVYAAVDRYQRDIGAAAGRGGYDSAGDAQRVVSRARIGVARLLGVAESRRIVFTGSGTESLNLAIFGLLGRCEGGHVVTTVVEHNSVLRPLAELRGAKRLEVDYTRCDEAGRVDPAAIAERIRPTTKLVVVTSASNVTGALQDIAAIGAVCRERGVPLLVDAAQSIGHDGLDVEACGVSMLAAPAHKGLLGPLGVGVLYLAPGLEDQLAPLQYGGTGGNSDQETPPSSMPDRYEAGNFNVPALAGLAAALDWRNDHPKSDSAASATARLVAGLKELPGVRLLGPGADEPRAPVVSCSLEGYDPQELAAILAASGIECRAGLHCAPRAHDALGTTASGGTLRLSPSFATTDAEIDAVLEAMRQLATSC